MKRCGSIRLIHILHTYAPVHSRHLIRYFALCSLTLPVILSAQNHPDAQPVDSSFVKQWQSRASETQAQQPHWITPLIAVTPRLEQELRYDLTSRTAPNGTNTTIYGGGKGLEIIPFRTVELIVGVPGYTVHRDPKIPSGYGDLPLLFKYRVHASNEAGDDDIVSIFLGASLPTGGKANGTGHAVVTPALAAGKGWGLFDLQATAGVNIPTAGASEIGHAMLYNLAAQYHVGRFLWPEIELNGTSWRDGSHDGMNQLFVTPGDRLRTLSYS